MQGEQNAGCCFPTSETKDNAISFLETSEGDRPVAGFRGLIREIVSRHYNG